jgi:hypothetical protein
VTTVDKPLRLGEVFAETIRIYGERVWAAFGIGAVTAATFLLAFFTHPAVDFVLISLAFTAGYAVAARVVAGDGFAEAWAQVAVRVPVLLVLTVVASLPFALAVSQLVLFVVGVAWLAFSGFSIPVAMLERERGHDRWFERIGFAVQRSFALARAEYFHAAGVIAALVLTNILFGVVLVRALTGFAENGGVTAFALAQVVLAPFFFLGLSVLYFEQRARALSSRGRS